MSNPDIQFTSRSTKALPPRRTACDRCRSHKLRCIRNTNNSDIDACHRCFRADTPCVTSATAKIGKKAGNTRRRDIQSTLRDVAESTDSSHHRSEEPEVQVDTPTSIAAGDRPNPSFVAAERSDGHRILHSLLTPSSASLGTPNTGSFGSSYDVRQLLGSTPASFDVLDPSAIQTLPPPLNAREECVRKLAGLHSALVLDLDIARGCQTADQCLAIIKMPEFSKNYNFMIGRMLNSSTKLIEVLRYFVPTSDKLEPKIIVRCDFPTLLSILTCYTYLIRIYRILLTSIHKSLVSPPAPPEILPPIFPGLELGGYSLEPHLDLQVKILVQVCEEMFTKINRLIGMSNGPDSSRIRGLLDHNGAFLQLTNSMLENELNEGHEEGILKGDRSSLAEIFQALREL